MAASIHRGEPCLASNDTHGTIEIVHVRFIRDVYLTTNGDIATRIAKGMYSVEAGDRLVVYESSDPEAP